MKKIILATVAVLCFGVAHADVKLSKSELKELAKSAQWHDNASYLSKDGKVRYSAHYELDKDGRPKLVAKKSYLPAVTDGINRTPKTSYFAIAPKTLKYVGKASRLTNPIGIGLLMIDVLGSEDWNVNPNNTITYTKNPDKPYCTWYSCADTPQMACDEWFSDAISKNPRFADRYVYSGSPNNNCLIYGGSEKYNGNLGAVVTFKVPQRQVMTDEQFEAIVRDLAKAGNINAKQVILDTVKDEIADGKHDSEIIRLADDISQDTPTDDTPTEESPPDNPTDPSQGTGTDTDPKTDTPTNPNTGTGTAIGTEDTPKDDTPNKTSSDLPAFCDWASIVCEFIGVKPDMPDVPVPTKDIELKNPAEFDKDYVRFGKQCPADVSVDVDMGFASHTVVFPFTPICDFVKDYLSWVVVLGAYLFATIHISSAFKV